MKTIFALFPDYHSAQAAVGALHGEDFHYALLHPNS